MEADSNYRERPLCEFGHSGCLLDGFSTLLHSGLSFVSRFFGFASDLGNVAVNVPLPKKREDRYHQRQGDGHSG